MASVDIEERECFVDELERLSERMGADGGS